MPGVPQYNSSAVRWDGQMPFAFTSPAQVFSNGSNNDLGGHTAPCDLQVVEAVLKIYAAATATDDTAQVRFGKQGDPDSHLDDYSIATLATGSHRLSATEFAIKTIDAGEAMEFGNTATAATITVGLAVVCMPRIALAT